MEISPALSAPKSARVSRVSRVWRGRPRHRELLLRFHRYESLFWRDAKTNTRDAAGRVRYPDEKIRNRIPNPIHIPPDGIRLGVGIGIGLNSFLAATGAKHTCARRLPR